MQADRLCRHSDVQTGRQMDRLTDINRQKKLFSLKKNTTKLGFFSPEVFRSSRMWIFGDLCQKSEFSFLSHFPSSALQSSTNERKSTVALKQSHFCGRVSGMSTLATHFHLQHKHLRVFFFPCCSSYQTQHLLAIKQRFDRDPVLWGKRQNRVLFLRNQTSECLWNVKGCRTHSHCLCLTLTALFCVF